MGSRVKPDNDNGASRMTEEKNLSAVFWDLIHFKTPNPEVSLKGGVITAHTPCGWLLCGSQHPCRLSGIRSFSL